jgi:hypothetical protein
MPGPCGARSASEPEIQAVLDRYRDEVVRDEWRGSGLDRETLLGLPERPLAATIAAVAD